MRTSSSVVKVLLSVVKVIRKFGFGGSFMSLRHLQSNLLQKLAFTWVFRISIYLVRNPPMRARDSLRTKVRSESVLNEYGRIGLPGGFTGVQFSSSELYHVTEIAQDKGEIQTVEKSSLHNFPF